MVRWRNPAASEAERRRRRGFEAWMDVYWCSAQAWWTEAEYVTMLYTEELRQYREHHPQPQL